MTKKLLILYICLAILPCVASADTGFLWLVNSENPLPESYTPKGLRNYHGKMLLQEPGEKFGEMLMAMQNEGLQTLQLQSGFRCYNHQKVVLRQREREVGQLQAKKSVQQPGASEHQLGLALDVSLNGKLEQAFGDTPEGMWLKGNCHKFGFILRYPANKTAITGISYEPWHLRYVGHPHASIMFEMDFALEEYLEFLRHTGTYLYCENNGYWLVMYKNTPPEPNGGEYSAFCMDAVEFVVVKKCHPTSPASGFKCFWSKEQTNLCNLRHSHSKIY